MAPSSRDDPALRALHHAVFFTTEHYRDKVEATGARFVPFAAAYDAHDLMVANPERESSSRRGVRRHSYRLRAEIATTDPLDTISGVLAELCTANDAARGSRAG